MGSGFRSERNRVEGKSSSNERRVWSKGRFRKAAGEGIGQNVKNSGKVKCVEVECGEGHDEALDHWRRIFFGEDEGESAAVCKKSEVSSIENWAKMFH
jgi:hypothetical protein